MGLAIMYQILEMFFFKIRGSNRFVDFNFSRV